MSTKVIRKDKERLGDRTRRRILDHAARILRQKGYASTSLRDIATAAEMQIGSLYYHFGSKDELVEAVLTEGIKLVETHMRSAVSKAREQGIGPLEVIRIAMITHMEAVHDKRDYASANVKCFSHMPAEIKANLRVVRNELDGFWKDILDAAFEADLIPDGIDPLTLRMAIIGMMNWTLEWHRVKQGSPADLGQQFFDIVFRR